jgi:tRNA A37 threonylcarbamoyladenosine synthetase subunit TsaC/SUA5/YrdC
MASTVLDLTVSPAAILRAGPVTADALRQFVDLKAD